MGSECYYTKIDYSFGKQGGQAKPLNNTEDGLLKDLGNIMSPGQHSGSAFHLWFWRNPMSISWFWQSLDWEECVWCGLTRPPFKLVFDPKARTVVTHKALSRGPHQRTPTKSLHPSAVLNSVLTNGAEDGEILLRCFFSEEFPFNNTNNNQPWIINGWFPQLATWTPKSG